MKRKSAITVGTASFLGLADSLYLSLHHVSGTTPACSLIEGCDLVLASSYATVLGVPVAFIGVAFYSALFFGALAYLSYGKHSLLRATAYLAIAGFAGTLVFLYLQAVVLRAFCEFCIVSAILSTALFVFAVIILKKEHSYEEETQGAQEES